MHPLLQLLMKQPALLGEHAQGYGELLVSDLSAYKQAAMRRLVWAVAAALLVLVGMVLGGVAVMLWATQAGLSASAMWVLWVTPGVPLVLALLCALRMNALASVSALGGIREQIQADTQMLQEANTP